MPTLSVVAPLFNEEGNVAELVRRLRAAADGVPGIDSYEIVLVDDGSTDRTVELLRMHAAADPRLVDQLAATAGLDISRGELGDDTMEQRPWLICHAERRFAQRTVVEGQLQSCNAHLPR